MGPESERKEMGYYVTAGNAWCWYQHWAQQGAESDDDNRVVEVVF